MRRQILALGLVGALATAACSSSASGNDGILYDPNPSTRPVTTAEADRLAVMRFRNYQDRGVRFKASVPSGGGRVMVVADVDYRARVGYVQLTGAGQAFSAQFDATHIVFWPSDPELRQPPASVPTTRGSVRALAPKANDVDALLALVLTLGQDRPDNPQLLRQDGATWLYRTTLDGVRVDVIQGPRASGAAPGAAGSVTYSIDAQGRLRELVAAFGGGPATTISVDAAGFRSFTRSGQLPG